MRVKQQKKRKAYEKPSAVSLNNNTNTVHIKSVLVPESLRLITSPCGEGPYKHTYTHTNTPTYTHIRREKQKLANAVLFFFSPAVEERSVLPQSLRNSKEKKKRASEVYSSLYVFPLRSFMCVCACMVKTVDCSLRVISAKSQEKHVIRKKH